MNRRDLVVFIGLEILAIVWAGTVFSLVADRFYAGMAAGVYFISSAAYMAWRGLQWKDKWRSLTWYPLLAHLFGISIPMVFTRLLHAREPFETIRIWGLSGPEFHNLSGKVFTVLILGTVLDLARVELRRRKSDSSNS